MAEGFAIDSTILVDDRRGVPEAEAFLRPLAARGLALVHPVVAAELLVGAMDRRHLTLLDQFLSRLKAMPVKQADFVAALELIRSVHLSHKVGWPDCLIAATCMRLGTPLATLNEKHFRVFRGLRVVRPY